MLVLIVGISGNIGSKLSDALIRRDHSVRGLGRDPMKMTVDRKKGLESFHTFHNWYDEPRIREAIRGVDAVVCAYGPDPVLLPEGQLLLIRIIEELGVTVSTNIIDPLTC
jgi:nucleoside-diphosphate-sugar epimerase